MDFGNLVWACLQYVQFITFGIWNAFGEFVVFVRTVKETNKMRRPAQRELTSYPVKSKAQTKKLQCDRIRNRQKCQTCTALSCKSLAYLQQLLLSTLKSAQNKNNIMFKYLWLIKYLYFVHYINL